MTPAEISRALTAIADLYPPDVRARKLAAVPRLAYQMQTVLQPGGRLLDLGSGVGMMPLACQRAGMRVTIVDDFGDPVNQDADTAQTIDLFRREGVEVIEADASGFDPGEAHYDVVSTFASVEHWHRSPRCVLERCVAALAPGGRLVLDVPNAARISARLRLLIGRTTWAPWHAYWEPETFRSHVREWTVDDLHRAADALGLGVDRIEGHSWNLPRPVARVVDRRPTLAGEITLVAEKR